MKPIVQALTFDDVLLVPNYSEVVPTEVDTAAFYAQNKIKNSGFFQRHGHGYGKRYGRRFGQAWGYWRYP